MKVVYDVVSRKKKATKLNENNKMEGGEKKKTLLISTLKNCAMAEPSRHSFISNVINTFNFPFNK